MRINKINKYTKTNTILKCPVNKFSAVENAYHDTNQTDKGANLRREAAVIGEHEH